VTLLDGSPDVPGGKTGENSGNSRSLSDRLILFLATGCGLGYASIAPGTVGSLAGLPLAWGLHQLPVWAQCAGAVLCFIVGIPICGSGARQLGLNDPGAVVFDEIAAFAVVFLLTPFSLLSAALGFVLFRVFDILKPWPARRLERLSGGLGIMADDFAAGVYSAAVLWCIDRWYPLG
jgi:phosphatidylglycerophosphatase A